MHISIAQRHLDPHHRRYTGAQKLLAAGLFETDLVLMELLYAAQATADPSATLAQAMQQWLLDVQGRKEGQA